MVDSTSVRAVIREGEDRCLFNFVEAIEKPKDLGCLLEHLEEAKSRVNEYLTTLVEKQGSAGLAEEQAMSDGESSSSEDIEVNPKKSKDAFPFKVNAMSTILSNEAQLRYVTEWFQEWSEMQRGDFLGILLERCGPSGLVNGLLPGMENLGCKEDSARPPSLFQCRVKLFREWSNNWSQQEKDSLLASIKSIDPAFAEKYEEKLSAPTNEDDGPS